MYDRKRTLILKILLTIFVVKLSSTASFHSLRCNCAAHSLRSCDEYRLTIGKALNVKRIIFYFKKIFLNLALNIQRKSLTSRFQNPADMEKIELSVFTEITI